MRPSSHLAERLSERNLSWDDVLDALRNETYREPQEDGRVKVFGWVERLGYFMRVIIDVDGTTVVTAFPDGSYTRRQKRQS